MRRSVTFLLGSAVIAAVFAGIYYAPGNEQARTEGRPAFNLAPGEVRQTGIQPTLEGTPILVELVVDGEIDVYVMEKEWAASLADERVDALRLDQPFSFDRELSRTMVNDTYTFSLVSDGLTWMSVVLDNSDNYYDGDSASNRTANVHVTIRFIEEESRSLTLGYIAAVPSVLLVVMTIGRQAWRHFRDQP